MKALLEAEANVHALYTIVDIILKYYTNYVLGLYQHY